MQSFIPISDLLSFDLQEEEDEPSLEDLMEETTVTTATQPVTEIPHDEECPGCPDCQAERWRVGDRCTIGEGIPAIIIAIMVEYAGPSFRVAWWDDSNRKDCWVTLHELQPPEEAQRSKMGFTVE